MDNKNINREELIAAAKAQGIELTEDDLAEASGGYLHKAKFKEGERVEIHFWANKRDPARYGTVQFSLENMLYSILGDDGETYLCGPDKLERIK